jgi:hypothetical protein
MGLSLIGPRFGSSPVPAEQALSQRSSARGAPIPPAMAVAVAVSPCTEEPVILWITLERSEDQRIGLILSQRQVESPNLHEDRIAERRDANDEEHRSTSQPHGEQLRTV